MPSGVFQIYFFDPTLKKLKKYLCWAWWLSPDNIRLFNYPFWTTFLYHSKNFVVLSLTDFNCDYFLRAVLLTFTCKRKEHISIQVAGEILLF